MSKEKLHDIIYHCTREVMSVEEKLRIATIFIFCEKTGLEELSELLYTEDHECFIEMLQNQYSNYGVDLSINFSNPNVKSAFYECVEKYKSVFDKDGFLRAIHGKDEYAMAIIDIVGYDFARCAPKAIWQEVEFKLSLFDKFLL